MSQPYNWYQPNPSVPVQPQSVVQQILPQVQAIVQQGSQVVQPQQTFQGLRNNCCSLQGRSQTAPNQPIDFLLRGNSYYIGQTSVYSNRYVPSGAQFSEIISVRNKNRIQSLSMFISRLTPNQQFDRYYNTTASIQYTQTGKKYERNSTQGNGWNLSMTNRAQTSNSLNEVYEGEGVSEFLPPGTGPVQLRLERYASNDRNQVTHVVFYKYCTDSSNQWVPLSQTAYYYACPTV